MESSGVAVVVAPDGAWCAISCIGGVAVLGADGSVVGLPRGGAASVHAVAWLTNDRLAVGYADTPTVRIYQPDAPDALLTLEHGGDGTRWLYASPDGRRLAAFLPGRRGQTLQVFELPSGVVASAAEFDEAWDHARTWDEEGRALWTVEDCRPTHGLLLLRRIDLDGDEAGAFWLAEIPSAPASLYRFQRNARGLHLLVPERAFRLARDGSICEEIALPGNRSEHEFLEHRFLARDDLLIDWEGGWDTRTRVRRWSSEGIGPPVAVAPSGRWFVAHHRGEIGVYAAATGAPLGRCACAAEWAFALSPDGRWLAAVGDELQLYRIDADAAEAACDAIDAAAHAAP